MNYAHTLEAYRDAREMERWSIIGEDDQGRDERREIQRERMLDCAIELAYEQTDATADCCDINRIGG